MFELLAKKLPAGLTVFDFHPIQLRAYLEVMWDAWRLASEFVPTEGGTKVPLDQRELKTPPTPVVNGLHGVGARAQLENPIEALLLALGTAPDAADPRKGTVFRDAVRSVLGDIVNVSSPTSITRPWQHLMYAYLVENTRVFDIAEAVMRELLNGERLGPVINPSTHRWVRATEDLFYQPGTGFVASLTSGLRPDAGGVRRNAYFRMFGIDLNHGRGDQPYPYIKADAANSAFVQTLEQALSELWRAYINRRNQQGTDVTDIGALGELLSRLRAMMRDRRQKNVRALAREEFASVAMASWYKLLLTSDNDIVSDLRATASSDEERLRRMGDRVAMAPHSKARSLIQLADVPSGTTDPAVIALGSLPTWLLEIEDGRFEQDAAIRVLFDDTTAHTQRTLNIITHWSIATGRDLKSVPVANR